MDKVGVWSMRFRSADRPEVRDAAAELDELGWNTLWLPGQDGKGALDDVGHLLDAAPRSTVVTGVLNISGQSPQELTDRAAEFGPRAVIGLGVGNGRLASMGPYLDQLGSGIPRSRLLLGALGPRMVDLAVARTSGWHPFLVTPAYVARERARVGTGPIIAPHQAVILDSDPQAARAAARDEIGMFIGFPSYRNNLKRLGYGDDDLVPGGSDRLIDALVAHGTADDIARRVREHLDAGADHVALHVIGPFSAYRDLAFLTNSPF
jgi:probable F420-dependent oxidoreductase